MSVTPVNQDNVDENLAEKHDVSVTKNDTSDRDDTKINFERMLRYNKLVKTQIISKSYVEDGVQIMLMLGSTSDSEWKIILEEIRNKDYPLRKLQLSWGHECDASVNADFIELAKTIEVSTTLTEFICEILSIPPDGKSTVLLEAVKNNRSIKYLHVGSYAFEESTAHALAQTLMNKQTLLFLSMAVQPYPDLDYRRNNPIPVEAVIQLASSLQTTVLQRFSINLINDEGFKMLAQSLPKTLVHLNLSINRMTIGSIPTLRSYLTSNGKNLKELILDSDLATEYFEEQESSSLSTLKIIRTFSCRASLSRDGTPSFSYPFRESDSELSELLMDLRKDDTICHKIQLRFNGDYDPKQFNYVRNLLDKQFTLTSLIIDGYLSDPLLQLNLFREIEENDAIVELDFRCQINSDTFDKFVELLTNRNNIIRLTMSSNLNIRDEEAIMLIQGLKTNTVLQSLSLEKTEIGDIVFQAFLSSLPTSLSQLIMNDTLITEKSLPVLLAFVEARPNLKNISLNTSEIRINSLNELNVPDLLEKILKITNANHCFFKLGINQIVKEAVERTTDDWINLNDKNLLDCDILELCYELNKGHNRKRSINLRYNKKISSLGYCYLADILSSTINIDYLSITSNDMNEEARTTLLNGLRNNITLKIFEINDNKLNIQDIESIGYFIKNNPMIKQIDLRQCQIDTDSAIHLAKCLLESKLEILYLDENSISDHGCISLLSSLSPSMINLSLGGNKITESSLEKILSFIATNRTLKRFGIHSNPVFAETMIWEQAEEASKQNNICELY